MKQTTTIIDKIRLERAQIKALKLCRKYNCSLIDLLVLSIDTHANNTANKKN
jgi:hypothetical protein